jgi:hypothetical protein
LIRRILVCSESDLKGELRPTIVGREGIEIYKAERFQDARLLASTLDARAILVDRDIPKAKDLVKAFRMDEATRQRSLAVIARGPSQPVEQELLRSGANALFRLPPDEGWDERLSRLLSVPPRQDARLMVRIALEAQPETSGAILDLSTGGMRLATQEPLRVKEEIGFRFRLPDATTVAGRGRIARQAGPAEFGVEFVALEPDFRQAIQQFVRSARLG